MYFITFPAWASPRFNGALDGLRPHRTVCKPLVDRFSAEHRPSASHVRVVLLRPGFAAPKWEWYDRQPADWFDYDAECAKAKAASGDPGNLIASSVRAIVSDHAYYRAHGTDVLVVGRWSPADTLNRCIKALAPSGELFP
ncbi:hypothetical protein P8C59_009103 [Phyllachora maydis]|uniref:Uncharacterized protein n=1 Tax=Phyllachora maydis TaxID=1825666 RepID=A0AAD9IBY2_9PEZI|nr:hypothetical protein P8C59_009103 [Phyllachora maydis]